MTREEFALYKKTIKSDYVSLSSKMLDGFYIFSNDVNSIKRKVNVANVIVKYINEDLIIANEGSNINILTNQEIIKLSEVLNTIINKRYKPTFLLDVNNYKSIREGGF